MEQIGKKDYINEKIPVSKLNNIRVSTCISNVFSGSNCANNFS